MCWILMSFPDFTSDLLVLFSLYSLKRIKSLRHSESFFFLISETLVKSSEVSYDVAYFSKDIYWKEKLGCP